MMVDFAEDQLVFLHQGNMIHGVKFDPPFSARTVSVKDMEFFVTPLFPAVTITRE